MGIFEDLKCDEMTIPEFRAQVEKWVTAGDVPAEDVEFIVATEEAWREIEAGDYIKMSEEEFLREVETW